MPKMHFLIGWWSKGYGGAWTFLQVQTTSLDVEKSPSRVESFGGINLKQVKGFKVEENCLLMRNWIKVGENWGE